MVFLRSFVFVVIAGLLSINDSYAVSPEKPKENSQTENRKNRGNIKPKAMVKLSFQTSEISDDKENQSVPEINNLKGKKLFSLLSKQSHGKNQSEAVSKSSYLTPKKNGDQENLLSPVSLVLRKKGDKKSPSVKLFKTMSRFEKMWKLTSILTTPFKSKMRQEKEIPPSPFSIFSPETGERKFLEDKRIAMLRKMYDEGKNKKAVDSPYVRKINAKEELERFYKCKNVLGKTVYQRTKLFDPHALVLSKLGVWETNLDRMKRGLCPVGHKGIHDNAVTGLTNEVIRKNQKLYRIELQHVTQKDTGTDADPILEMTHAAHMGKNAKFAIRVNADKNEIEILASNLTKMDATAFLAKQNDPACFIVTNLLHFRKGESKINRDEFNSWREKYWKERAKDFEEFVKVALDDGSNLDDDIKKVLFK